MELPPAMGCQEPLRSLLQFLPRGPRRTRREDRKKQLNQLLLLLLQLQQELEVTLVPLLLLKVTWSES
jgi:hypothetical protein